MRRLAAIFVVIVLIWAGVGPPKGGYYRWSSIVSPVVSGCSRTLFAQQDEAGAPRGARL
jgi:hypothetical protein